MIIIQHTPFGKHMNFLSSRLAAAPRRNIDMAAFSMCARSFLWKHLITNKFIQLSLGIKETYGMGEELSVL